MDTMEVLKDMVAAVEQKRPLKAAERDKQIAQTTKYLTQKKIYRFVLANYEQLLLKHSDMLTSHYKHTSSECVKDNLDLYLRAQRPFQPVRYYGDEYPRLISIF